MNTVGFVDTGVDHWYKVAPATGANNLVTTMSGTCVSLGHGMDAWSGVNQSDPAGAAATNTGNATTASVDVSSVAGDVALGVLSIDPATLAQVTPADNQSWEWLNSNQEATVGSGVYQDGAATVTLDWTVPAQRWAVSGFSFKAAAAAAAYTAEFSAASFVISPQAFVRLNDYIAFLTARSFAFTAQAVAQLVSFTAVLTARSFALAAQALDVTALATYVAQFSPASVAFTAQALNHVNSWTAQISSAAFAFTAQALARINAFAAQLTTASFSLAGQALTYIADAGPRLAGWFITNRRRRR